LTGAQDIGRWQEIAVIQKGWGLAAITTDGRLTQNLRVTVE